MPNNPNFMSRRLGRRDVLRFAGLGAGAAALAACGVGGKGTPQATGTALADQTSAFWAGKTKTGSARTQR